MRRSCATLALVVLGVVVAPAASAQALAASSLRGNFASSLERPLRYTPDRGDFVIRNGSERFNRPLYGGNTAFRVDGGDRPEFVLYLPGRGGNLRFALRDAAGTVHWLDTAAEIVTRYRPGGLLYEIRDPALGRATLRLAVYALAETDGLIVRAEHDGASELELLWAYGGVNGERGRRDGDIGTERVPISEWFQLQPEFAAGNTFALAANAFELTAPLPREQRAVLRGVNTAPTRLQLANASAWPDAAKLFASVSALATAPERPVVIGFSRLAAGAPHYLAVQRVDAAATSVELDTYRAVTAPRVGETRIETATAPARAALNAAELPALFARTEAHFVHLRGQLRVETPDEFLNAAVAALNVAADAVWDEPQGVVMHGAIAWRSKLLGWRGPYAMDALGWPDRARRHLAYWATRQNNAPIPARLPLADTDSNLARNEAGLHSNGDLSNSHYDMNLVYIDALFRHLLWTGDLHFAREVWPVIERHLAWQRRLFRREFDVGGEKLPLYEAYAAIWASDDLQYHGGGAVHASAYNVWHNRMAARLAPLLGHDGAAYAREADLIERGMQRLLWTGSHYAEFKDWLGLQLRHDSAALWSFYHAADSGLLTGGRASDDVQQRLPRLPIRGPGVPTDRDYAMFATTDWLPYTWSLNNVVMGENVHTALGFWIEGRPDDAFTLLKSSLLASMFMGICPGNVGSMNYLDVYRRESQRDFGDGAGVTSRAIVEGLFGVRPDALAGTLRIVPGWPADWPAVTLDHKSVSLRYEREGERESYTVEPRFGKPMALQLHLPRRGPRAAVSVDGAPVETTTAGERVVVSLPAGSRRNVEVVWSGEFAAALRAPLSRSAAVVLTEGWGRPLANGRRTENVDLAPFFNDRVTEIFRPMKYLAPRSPFVSLAMPAQGLGAWAGHVNATAEIDDTGLRAAGGREGGVCLPTGVTFATPGPGAARNAVFVSQWDNYPREATVPLVGRAHRLHLLMAGSTNAMQSRLDNGEVLVAYADGSTARLPLRNPETWWPIEQDYFLDDYQFDSAGPLPIRVDLKSGAVRVLTRPEFLGRGRAVLGGAATALELALDPAKELRSLTVRALANEVVIGLLAASLEREETVR